MGTPHKNQEEKCGVPLKNPQQTLVQACSWGIQEKGGGGEHTVSTLESYQATGPRHGMGVQINAKYDGALNRPSQNAVRAVLKLSDHFTKSNLATTNM